MAKHIVVIGGGMAGTSAAQALIKRGYKVTILEKNDYLGGRVRTLYDDGAVVEMGAAFMTRIYSNILNFLRENELYSDLYKQKSKSGIVLNGQVRMANFKNVAGSGILDIKAKAQITSLLLKTIAYWPRIDHHAFWKTYKHSSRTISEKYNDQDSKLLENLLQPVLNGYFYWPPEKTSEAMLLILCKAAIKQGATYKMESGLKSITDKAAGSCKVLVNHSVQEIANDSDGGYKITASHDGNSKSFHPDGVICATTASVVPKIYKELSKNQMQFFRSVEYSSTAVMAKVYKSQITDVSKGIALPRRENSGLAAVTVDIEVGKERDLSLLKVYSSGVKGKVLCGKSDDEISSYLMNEFKSVGQEIAANDYEPLATYIQRWPEALPLFNKDHFKRLRAFESGEIEDSSKPIVFAGDYLGGPFMEGAFTSGIKAAERLDARMG